MNEAANPRIARLRNQMAIEGFDAVVLTHPHDVRYATGYHSILERWTQMEPFAVTVDDFRRMLDRHLVDEEEIVIPVLLKLSAG